MWINNNNPRAIDVLNLSIMLNSFLSFQHFGDFTRQIFSKLKKFLKIYVYIFMQNFAKIINKLILSFHVKQWTQDKKNFMNNNKISNSYTLLKLKRNDKINWQSYE